MQLKEYLLKKRIDPIEFSLKCKLSPATIYRCMRGMKCHMKNAKIIEKMTNGEVSVEELI